jgi:hypothetical protein
VTCAPERADVSAVRRWTKIPDDPYTVRAGSWTAAVAAFAGVLEDRYFHFRADIDAWDSRTELLPDLQRGLT